MSAYENFLERPRPQAGSMLYYLAHCKEGSDLMMVFRIFYPKEKYRKRLR